MGQARWAFEQEEGHRNVIGQQGEPFDAWARFGQQRIERAIHIAAKRQLFRMNFDGAGLLSLHSSERLVGDKAGLHRNVRTAARKRAV